MATDDKIKELEQRINDLENLMVKKFWTTSTITFIKKIFFKNNINFSNLPTSDTGLNVGDTYSDSGTLKIKT